MKQKKQIVSLIEEMMENRIRDIATHRWVRVDKVYAPYEDVSMNKKYLAVDCTQMAHCRETDGEHPFDKNSRLIYEKAMVLTLYGYGDGGNHTSVRIPKKGDFGIMLYLDRLHYWVFKERRPDASMMGSGSELHTENNFVFLPFDFMEMDRDHLGLSTKQGDYTFASEGHDFHMKTKKGQLSFEDRGNAHGGFTMKNEISSLKKELEKRDDVMMELLNLLGQIFSNGKPLVQDGGAGLLSSLVISYNTLKVKIESSIRKNKLDIGHLFKE